jgi:predicted Zn-dependent peptidase
MKAQIDRSVQPKPEPAPEIKLEKPVTFKLKNGLEVLVVENHKLPRVTASLTLDNPPIVEGEKAGLADLTGSLIGNGSKNLSKEKFDEKVDYLGARVNFWATGARASSLSKYFPEVFGLMADAALNPVFSKEEFDKKVAQTKDGLKSEEKNAKSIANRVRKVIGYGKNHPYGEFTSKESIEKISLEDVKNHYNTYFKPNHAYLVVVGDVNPKEVKKLVKKYFKKWKQGEIENPEFPTPKNVAKTEIDFINMPDAVQSQVGAVYTTKLQMKDPDYHAVLVANQILGGDFNSYLNMNLREKHGYTYGARSSINPDKYASMFRTSASVRNEVTDSTVMETLKEINRIRTENVTKENLRNVKASYSGKFVRALEQPRTVANYALNIKTNDLPEDFYKNYLKNINAVTVEDVKRVANKYFDADHARIIVVGKAVDVLPNLEKIGLKINYFDKYGNPTKKPKMSKPIPKGVTVKTVVDKFVKAIGGKDKVNAIKSVKQKFVAEIQGQKLEMTKIDMAPNKSASIVSVGGMVMNKTVFDGKKGYVMQRGMKKDLTGKDLEKNKNRKHLLSELDLVDKGELIAIEPIDGKDAYVIKKDDEKIYFDVDRGFKIRIVKTKKDPTGKAVDQVINFADYKEVDGLKVPQMVIIPMGPMVLEFKAVETKINKDVTDADFE